MRTTLTIDGMHCDQCILTIDRALRALPGIEHVEVDLGQAVIEHEESVDPIALRNSIEAEGYRVAQ